MEVKLHVFTVMSSLPKSLHPLVFPMALENKGDGIKVSTLRRYVMSVLNLPKDKDGPHRVKLLQMRKRIDGELFVDIFCGTKYANMAGKQITARDMKNTELCELHDNELLLLPVGGRPRIVAETV